MTNIASGYFIIGGIFLIFVIFLLIFKLLISDFFYELTGRKIFYIREMDSKELVDEIYKVNIGRKPYSVEILKLVGSRELIDSIWIPFISTYICLTILFIAYILYLISDSYLPFYLGSIPCGLILYFTFLIYLRMKVFYFGGSKVECEKRCPVSYPRVSYTWTLIISGGIIIFLMLSTAIPIFIYGLIASIILAHIYIFPDYMNKILPYDLRTVRGSYQESSIIVGSILAIFFFGGIFIITR